jgi:hypothetical protein
MVNVVFETALLTKCVIKAKAQTFYYPRLSRSNDSCESEGKKVGLYFDQYELLMLDPALACVPSWVVFKRFKGSSEKCIRLG